MIAFIKGNIALIRNDRVVIDVHGVGYEVYLANATACKKGEEIFLYTYQHVREDAILLFGFLKETDYEVFMRLINVKGIGPKTALNLLSVCPGDEMVQAIENDDIRKLKGLPGIGAKTAGQIVLDLKGKFVAMENETAKEKDPVWESVVVALESLGYKQSSLNGIYDQLDRNLKEDEMLRAALKLLAKRNGV